MIFLYKKPSKNILKYKSETNFEILYYKWFNNLVSYQIIARLSIWQCQCRARLVLVLYLQMPRPRLALELQDQDQLVQELEKHQGQACKSLAVLHFFFTFFIHSDAKNTSKKTQQRKFCSNLKCYIVVIFSPICMNFPLLFF